MTIPTDLRYTADHEWVRLDADLATIGITAYAADALGDVVFVELPTAGTVLVAGERCGEIESTKSVSDLLAPVDGEVVEVNERVVADPALVNTDPFGEGWLLRVRAGDTAALLDHGTYAALVAQQ